jgi:nucleoside-diphosphate-sugar epimerase
MLKTVLVTGGAGYVGSALVPRLLAEGFAVRVLDLYLYGEDVLQAVKGHPHLTEIKGDIRDQELLRKVLPGCDAVIHLACISNDPSFELNPALGKSINFDAFRPLVEIARESGVQRFIYASSASVYGVKDAPEVTEEMSLEPLTDYSKYKAMCEDVLRTYESPSFTTVIVRPTTVCGYAPRQRLDVIVNILTNHAVHTGKIQVHGGEQKRPNMHIHDTVELYLLLLQCPRELVAGKTFNANFENHTVRQLAELVRGVVGPHVTLEIVPTIDNRSYHVSSEKIARELGFRPKRTIEDAVRELMQAFQSGKLPNALTDSRYFNIKRMQEVKLR